MFGCIAGVDFVGGLWFVRRGFRLLFMLSCMCWKVLLFSLVFWTLLCVLLFILLWWGFAGVYLVSLCLSLGLVF